MKFLRNFLACFLALILFFFILFVLPFGILLFSLTTSSQSKSFSEGSVLHLDLSGEIRDLKKQDNPLIWLDDTYQKSYYLNELRSVLKKASSDSSIVGISLTAENLNSGYATLSEVRQYLEEFKKSGKFIYAYSGNYSQANYFLASVADSIFLNPVGSLQFKGFSTTAMFYKGFLDKVGVDMQVVKVGAYKSFTEKFSSDSMSVENRAQTELLSRTIWNSVLDDISKSRYRSVEVLNQYADELLYFDTPQELVEKGMIDVVCYKDEYLEILKKRARTESLELVKYKDFLPETQSFYEPNISLGGSEIIEVICAEGEIDGFSEDGIDSEKCAERIMACGDDSNVQAIVLRVNSPGGSAYGAEQIWRAVKCARKNKPVIVSMGDYAASGGYYISTAANYIVANPATITGSIGVFSVIPSLDSLAKKLGVSVESVNTNEHSNFGSTLLVPMSDEVRQKMQKYTEFVYDTFLQRCAEGRNLSIDSVKSLAEGRVWSGQSAYELGLVDKLGTLEDAISLAVDKAGLTNYSVRFHTEDLDFLQSLKEEFMLRQKKLGIDIVFSKENANFEQFKSIDRQQALIPFQYEIK